MDVQGICKLLQATLSASTINQAEKQLQSRRQQPGFLTNLLIISDDANYNMTIRQSALVYIKTALIDDYKDLINLPENDFETVKSSILQALIRNCHEKMLTPTMREIIFVLAQNYYPTQWPNIVPEIACTLQNSGDFAQLVGSIEALKAIVSAIVKNVDRKMTLQNTCNRIVLPLLHLASKLFQSYNQTTSSILIMIFKIFSTITHFHIPEVIMLNMHSFLIFVKKILDLNLESGNIDQNMYQLKKICLRIMFRFYQLHLKSMFSSLGTAAVKNFHEKFTKGITESLLLQIINESTLSSTSQKNFVSLTQLSLACLAHVYEEDKNAAQMIDGYKEKILFLCMQRYKVRVAKEYSSYGEFLGKIREQRVHLCAFVKALIKNVTKVKEEEYKGNSYVNLEEANSILAYLYGYLAQGNQNTQDVNQVKQLCLYIYSHISTVLPLDHPDIQQKMQTFILTVVKPLLNTAQTPTIIKLRCCEILARYSSVDIPETDLSDIASGVYSCLISNQKPDTGSMETFLQIHAVYAFNGLLRYDYIINFSAPHLNSILPVYTSLLEIQVSMFKCLEDMLAKFQNHLQPYGNDLLDMLIGLFLKYHQLLIDTKSQIKKKPTNPNQTQDSDDQFQTQNIQNNYENASKACLGAVRQIIQAPLFQFQKDELIHNILISIFSDPHQHYIEEGFNILNQVVFKAKFVKPEYNLYFTLIIYGYLPLNQDVISKLKAQNNVYCDTLVSMLAAMFSQPDSDFVSDTIGCVRNFISKYQDKLRDVSDNLGVSFLDLVMNAVKYVHENQSGKATQADRLIILTLYMSLVQWKALNDNQVKDVLQNVGMWMNMEKEACQGNDQGKKTVYSPIYLQIILLGVHFYPNVTLNVIGGDWIANQVLNNWERIHCDYEISRLLVGVADLFNFQAINDQNVGSEIINRLPEVIEKQCQIRVGEDDNDIQSVDDEAEEEQYFGLDENTHMMGWSKPKMLPQPQQQQQQMDDQEEEEEDQQEEFNKYYQSPLDQIDQISYLANSLKSQNCQAYMNLMRNEMQIKLSQLIQNAPPKFPGSN